MVSLITATTAWNQAGPSTQPAKHIVVFGGHYSITSPLNYAHMKSVKYNAIPECAAAKDKDSHSASGCSRLRLQDCTLLLLLAS